MTKALSDKPQFIDDHTWYYEEAAGIHLVRESVDESGNVSTDQIVIPWRLLRGTFERAKEAGKA